MSRAAPLSVPRAGLRLVADPHSLLARFETHTALVVLVLASWVAQFHHFRDFGLYEDDYWFIARAMGQDPAYLASRLQVFASLPQGRPLGFFLPDLFSFVGDKLGGLPAIYLLGWLIVSLNTFLCYRLLRTRLPALPALSGALAFCLFPADTTKILLTHDFQLQPSLTFLLLASLAYAAGRSRTAYVLSAGSLLAYENAFLPFFGVPLLVHRWNRRGLPREMLRHVLVLLGIVAGAVAVRFLVGEGRATESITSLPEIVPKVLGSLVLGPVRSLESFGYGPLKAVPGWDAETGVLAVGSFVALAWLFSGWRSPQPASAARIAPGGTRRPLDWSDMRQVAAAGLLMLVLAYSLAFTHFPPNALVGRGTSVHLGASLGAAVLFAAAAWALLAWRPRLAAGLLAGYLALALAYAITIERDFVHSWQLQRAFWQEVARCCLDLQEGTVLLYELDPADETPFIFTNSWADPLVLSQTFQFPAEWTTPPRLFSLPRWQERVEADGDQLRWWVPGASWDEHWETLPAGNVILLRRVNGQLVRSFGSVAVAGRSLALKDKGADGQWPHAQLYQLLLT